MEKILDKISEYSIVTCMLPGIFFCFLCEKLYDCQLYMESGIVENIFIYYLWGLLLSRIGALIIEPLLIKIKIIKQYDYYDYIDACKQDDKISTFLQVNNMYRTLAAMGLGLLGVGAYTSLAEMFGFADLVAKWVLVVGIVLIFVLSCRRQTKFISKRVEKVKQEKKDSK